MDFHALGDRVWERFSADKESQIWYYSELAKSFKANVQREVLFEEFSDLMDELVRAVEDRHIIPPSLSSQHPA